MIYWRLGSIITETYIWYTSHHLVNVAHSNIWFLFLFKHLNLGCHLFEKIQIPQKSLTQLSFFYSFEVPASSDGPQVVLSDSYLTSMTGWHYCMTFVFYKVSTALPLKSLLTLFDHIPGHIVHLSDHIVKKTQINTSICLFFHTKVCQNLFKSSSC